MAPHVKNSKNLIHRAQITTDPQKAIAEYFISKAESRNIKKLSEWDVARISPAAELVKARRELDLAENQLIEKQQEQIEKRKEMDKHWAELRRKELIFRQSFQKFNKFAKENQEKRERAEHKIAEELLLQNKRREEIKEMESKLNDMKEIKKSMEKHVADYGMYQEYLEKVISETGQFQSISEILTRYESLTEARKELSERQDENLQALEDASTEMVRLTDDKAQKLINLNNKLADLQGRYDKAKVNALRWETAVQRIKETTAAKHLELTQVRACCWNVYQQICRRKGIPVEVDRDDVEHQLVHIKRTILELKRIVRVARRKAQTEAKSKDA
ncbi:coiled-coil domain-containing protein 42 homolog [Diprion similis]|uniref:coiled-coil domain-containing protein 42 homolog n=1 Tax=Diprion similis TaxID=362088 RepID=UPI001EF77CC1|nr:coiled-coil domain-containing protein 42 homolog [Diprion similis]